MAALSFLLHFHRPPPCPSPASLINCCRVKATHEPILRFSRRKIGAASLMGSVLLAKEAKKAALGFEFRMMVPDQTAEEAQGMVRDHARALLNVKALIESESWREAQQQLRKSASYLKQDIYTIIQSKPESFQPQLRKLYFDLFSSVSKLDYAARDKDAARVWECYNNITVALGDILSRI